ncbi:MAG TPA: NAD(P)/FAD-dependent oxidoreductase [Actinomycetales bacterium]|nr:NAD(P)/FAD-dependent oxidoreductase [Actinomycetales bacterium]
MRVPTVVIGAGHSGLAVSHFLTERGIEHVVLERGQVANSWRTERWDSLRLLTPNAMTRLPGLSYDGDDPDGYLTMPEVVAFVERYARQVGAPVVSGTRVTSVRRVGDAYEVITDGGSWTARSVVLATGAFNAPRLPRAASQLPDSVDTVTAHGYRNPDGLADGGVLVVGASATGVQIAAELQRSGRAVTIAVGEHVRMPRTYRGRDVMWWMERSGILDERYDEVDDVVRARHLGSPQLIGTPQRATLDLNALTQDGARLVGRLMGYQQGRVQLSGSLRNVCTLADLKMRRLLGTFDDWASDQGLDSGLGEPERYEPTRVPQVPALALDLAAEGIRTIVWATGFRPDYSWLDVPVLDRKGEVRHDGGVVRDAPGLYRVGLPMLRRRKSSYIHGAEDDARDITEHLDAYLHGRRLPAA